MAKLKRYLILELVGNKKAPEVKGLAVEADGVAEDLRKQGWVCISPDELAKKPLPAIRAQISEAKSTASVLEKEARATEHLARAKYWRARAGYWNQMKQNATPPPVEKSDAPPDELCGEPKTESVAEWAARHRVDKVAFIKGVQGVGAEAMLNEIQEMAEDDGPNYARVCTSRETRMYIEELWRKITRQREGLKRLQSGMVRTYDPEVVCDNLIAFTELLGGKGQAAVMRTRLKQGRRLRKIQCLRDGIKSLQAGMVMVRKYKKTLWTGDLRW